MDFYRNFSFLCSVVITPSGGHMVVDDGSDTPIFHSCISIAVALFLYY